MPIYHIHSTTLLFYSIQAPNFNFNTADTIPILYEYAYGFIITIFLFKRIKIGHWNVY